MVEVKTTEGPKIEKATTQEHKWIPDEQAPFCMSCNKKFNWRFRRHHCRICKRVFCSNCSQTSDILINGEILKQLVCKKDLYLHSQMINQMNKQKILLRDQVSAYERMQDSKQFLENQDLPQRDFIRRESKMPKNTSSSDMQNHFEFEQNHSQEFLKSRSSIKHRNTITSQEAKNPESLAMNSQSNKQAMEKFLEKNADEQIFDERGTLIVKPRETASQTLGQRPSDAEPFDKKEPMRDQMKSWIDKKLAMHIQQMIDVVISEFGIDPNKWRRMMTKSTQNAVQTIHPSSRLLNDSIDFNSFIKIITLEYPNQDKCQYVNGVVYKKDVAHRRMQTQIENPKILILKNSLGYVHDEQAMVDLSAEINQENYNMQIIMQSIKLVDPHIIFVEHEASRLALETLFKDQRTVVTNVHPKMMAMIARSTQTIICPSTNLIDRNFILGSCLKFRVEHIEPDVRRVGQADHNTIAAHTSLMFLEGCQSKLGCSIVISGPDKKELKTVRMAMKKCLKTARVLVLEREYLRFVRPDPKAFLLIKDQPEESKNEIQEDVDLLQQQSENNLPQNAKIDSEFQQLDTPYLYEKDMKRDNLVFEVFSLVSRLYDNQDETAQSAQESMLDDQSQIDISRFVEDPNLNEAAIKQRIKTMCSKPRKVQIKFYDEESDISLYQMIKKLATQALQTCENKECRKLRLLHTDYFYHNNGCVEIKYRQDSNAGETYISEQDDYPVSVFCYCNQCKNLAINKIEAPTQMLEMSFYKLLEQFFYNQKVVSFGHSPNQQMCNHQFHRSYSMIFCYGPIRVMLNYESLDEYTLDLQHFGSTPGVTSKDEQKAQAKAKLGDMQLQLQDAFYFTEEKAGALHEWLKLATEEFTSLCGQAINPLMTKFTAFVQEFVIEVNNRRGVIFKELFSIDLGANMIQEDDFTKTRLIDQIDSELKANRVMMHIGRRLSELLFLLRKVHSMVINKLLPKLFGKRSCFERHQEQYMKLNTQSLANSDEQISRNTQLLMRPENQPLTQSSTFKQADNKVPGKSNSISLRESTDTQANEKIKESEKGEKGPSKLLKDGYLVLADFEAALLRNNAIASLLSESVLDCGFDEGKISVNGQDICSIIAFALNSNLYIEGLAKIEYLQMHQNFKPVTDRISDLGKDATEFAMKQFGMNDVGNKLMISPDVLNDEITLAMAENELQRENNHFSFIISGSTTMPAQAQILSMRNETVVIDQSKQRRFQNQAELLNLSFLEKPVSETLLLMMCKLEGSVDRMKIQHNFQQQVFKKKLGMNQQEELDFATLAIGALGMPAGQSQLKKKNSERGPRVGDSQVRIRTTAQSQLGSAPAQVSQKQMLKTSSDAPVISKKKESDNDFMVVQISEADDDQNQDPALLALTDMHSEMYGLFHKHLDFNVKLYFVNQFEALRKVYCGSYTDFIQSISRSEVWGDNSGGKTRSPFFKTHDQKYVIKVVKHNEIKMFETMGDSYFDYLAKSFTQQQPTGLSKILGMFRIRMRVGMDSKVEETYCILMENLLLGVDESIAIKYDLKGSERNRYVTITKPKQVALDTNFLYDMKSRPIPLQFQMRKVLQIAMANDSLYLAKHQIIDYSLFLIIDPAQKTIRVGIIDYMQMYTIEKELESYIKQTVSNVKPTIVDPYEYKNRFRKAIDKYFISLIPDEDKSFGALLKPVQWFTKHTTEIE